MALVGATTDYQWSSRRTKGQIIIAADGVGNRDLVRGAKLVGRVAVPLLMTMRDDGQIGTAGFGETGLFLFAQKWNVQRPVCSTTERRTHAILTQATRTTSIVLIRLGAATAGSSGLALDPTMRTLGGWSSFAVDMLQRTIWSQWKLGQEGSNVPVC